MNTYIFLFVDKKNDPITNKHAIPVPEKKAVCFCAFLIGFIAVLCIGNYFRAKRAQERQRQRRLAKLAAGNDNGTAQGTYATDASYAAGSYEAPAISAGVPA